MRPIIELTGAIGTSSVNMSVSFIQELKILRYLRKNVKVRDPSDITTSTGFHHYFISAKESV